MNYCVTDIETTGGNYSPNCITEIASFITDGTKIIKTFSSLIKPDGLIPRNITLLTGITNEMVADAPRFEDIATEWVDFAKDAVFVAHNVSFDLGFIQKHLEELHINYRPNKLCTVRLSRKILKGFPSYSLGNLCNQLNIKIKDRHRASGDAAATVQLLHYLLLNDKKQEIDKQLNNQQKTFAFPPLMDESEYHKLPSTAGVYYLKDKNYLQ